MRIAVLNKGKCSPKRCSHECYKYCPRVRMGDETIVLDRKGRPVISEELCVGCGICVHKCPFDAIHIIGLPEALDTDLIHQYEKNGFRLFRLPTPRDKVVTGLLGPNGIGKTTTINILSGNLVPNLGNYGDNEGKEKDMWERVLKFYAGTEMHSYLQKVASGELTTVMKPQYVDHLPRVHRGEVRSLLAKVDTGGRMKEVAHDLEILSSLKKDIRSLSGGELQRVALAATILKDADIYFFDEPSSYLDIHQRLRIARIIRQLSREKQVMVIEHDLAVLDFLCETVYLMYGVEGAYGVVAQPRGVRQAINTYLSGYLREENIRVRDYEIRFDPHPPRTEWGGGVLMEFPELKKKIGEFSLSTDKGRIHNGEVIGILGPNATGKTTFVKMLAGVIDADEGKVEAGVRVSYKPQYIEADLEIPVRDFFAMHLGDGYASGFYKSEIEKPMKIHHLYNKDLTTLSGGELQRVATALALTREADIYLIDEPSAYLDSNQRMETAKTIRRVMEKLGKSAMVVDHDVYLIDLISDSLMVFSGTPAIRGNGKGPFNLRTGMNRFLEDVNITFRRDADTHRPRINKEGSHLDRTQRAKGEYYYA